MTSPESSSTTPAGGSPGNASELGMRVLYMVVFAFALWVLAWVLAATALAQLVLKLVNGRPSEDLARFGGGLGRYAGQVVAWLTFAEERLPFPFSDWPGREAREPTVSGDGAPTT